MKKTTLYLSALISLVMNESYSYYDVNQNRYPNPYGTEEKNYNEYIKEQDRYNKSAYHNPYEKTPSEKYVEKEANRIRNEEMQPNMYKNNR